jgi:hypothetical protein
MADPFDPGWVPVKFARTGVQWARRGDWRFGEPFFLQTVRRRIRPDDAGAIASQSFIRFAMQPWTSPDEEPQVAGIIFQVSRCGSTAISQMLARDPKNIVLSEPDFMSMACLDAWKGRIRGESVHRLAFLGAIRSFAFARKPVERRIFIKAMPGNIHSYNWIRSVLPGTPCLFIYRQPEDVVASNLSKPPEWLGRIKSRKKRLKIMRAVLRRQMSAGLKAADRGLQLVNYREIGPDFPEKLDRLFALGSTPEELAAMRESLRWYSKGSGIPWNPEAQDAVSRPGDRSIPPLEIRRLYGRLEARRVGALLG